MRPVNEVLEHPVVHKRGHRDSRHREDHAIGPPGDQATDGYGDADRDERDSRPRQREPGQDTLMTSEGRDHRSVHDRIEPVRVRLFPEQEAERGDDGYTRSQHRPGPGSPGIPQQRHRHYRTRPIEGGLNPGRQRGPGRATRQVGR